MNNCTCKIPKLSIIVTSAFDIHEVVEYKCCECNLIYTKMEIIKINELKYIVEDIEVFQNFRGKWIAKGFLTKGQFKEFKEFIKPEIKSSSPKIFVPTQDDLSRIGKIVSKQLSEDKVVSAGTERIKGELKHN